MATTVTNASAIAAANAANKASAAQAAAAATAAQNAMAKQTAAKQAALTALQSSVKAKTTGVGAINSAATTTAAQTAIDLSNQAITAQQAANTASAYTPVNVPAPILSTDTTDLTSDMNALAQLQSLYSGMGLGPDIATALTNLIKEGYTPDTLKLIAQDPNAVSSSDPYIKQFATAYNTRFVANADRIKNGFAPLAPADYIARESAYRSAMASAGLPPEFYNTNAALSGWIANNVDTATVQAKINIASDVVNNYDQTAKDQALALYGLDTGHLIAHILDPVAALPIIQKQANIVQLGADAARAGVAQNLDTLTQLNTIGTTQSAATQAFGNIAAELPSMQAIASRYSGYGPAGTIEQSLEST